MSRVLVAAAQLGPASETRAGTVARIVRLIEQAGAAGVRLIVFPELALTPYFATRVHDIAPWVEDEFPSTETRPIVDAAAAARVEVVLPFAERAGSGATCYNSAVLISADGCEIGRYRKMHIPGHVEPDRSRPVTFLEKRYFIPGDLGFPVYQTGVARVGMAICYDHRFPETYRVPALDGAELIAIGHNTPAGEGPVQPGGHGYEQVELAMRAGAYANGVPVIAAGKIGHEWDLPWAGGSVVIGPRGEVLARAATDGDELVAAEIDLTAAAAVRDALALATNRRPEHYGTLTRRVLSAEC
jgi:N-carbamoyl-D-amino-acid hydrolase